MEHFKSETIAVLVYLLPGFVAAWQFYGLTSHPKPSQFERVVQALIFTFVIQSLLPLIRGALEIVGKWAPLHPWDKSAEALASLMLAGIFGALLAHFTNNDSIHRWLRTKGFTTRTSHPSEWFCVFSERVTYVILHMKDGRRLYGWPKEWPVDPGRGQLYIQLPSWITEDGSLVDLPQLDGILVNVNDVQWVEFLGSPEGREDDK
jgi:hypothetical protein